MDDPVTGVQYPSLYEADGNSQTVDTIPLTSEWVRHSIQVTTLPQQTQIRIYPLRRDGPIAWIYQLVTVLPETTYTYSAWYKKVGTKVYVWGCQLVKGSEAGDYYKTTGTISGPPRYSHDPETLTPTGLYLEPAATNLATDSANLTHLTNRDSTDTQNAGIAPDGTNTAVRLAPNTDYDRHGFELNYNTLQNTSKTHSIFVKADPNGNGRYVQFGSGRSAGDLNAHTLSIFDAKTGQITDNIAHPSGGGLISKVESFPNGWYRLTVEISATGGSTQWSKIYLTPYATQAAALAANNNNLTTTQIYGSHKFSVTDTTKHNILVWGHQVEAGLGSTSYIPTSGAAATRNADIFTSTATEVLDRANGTKPAFFTKDGISVCAQGMYNNLSVDTHNLNRIAQISAGSAQVLALYQQSQGSQNLMQAAIFSSLPPAGNTYVGLDGVSGTNHNVFAQINGRDNTTSRDLIWGVRYDRDNTRLYFNDGISTDTRQGSLDTTVTLRFTNNNQANRLDIGQNSNNLNQIMNGTVKRITFWKTPLTDNKLDRLTA
jgi:hypothetical protein